MNNIHKNTINENNDFYLAKDNMKIDSFILIPKVLLMDEKYKKLTILAKMMYSLYLNRYSSTIYKDEYGPYIIFSDADIGYMLKASRSAVVKNRNALKDAGLINYARSVGNNKIYIYNFRQNTSNDIFFHKSDIENMRFIRYPIDFFEDQFDDLPLQSKFLYSLYYDLMCLSQAYYYTDDHERIYFQENIDEQVKRFGLNSNTIRKYREYLKATGLLFEYHPFKLSIRYYILKLSNFKNNIKEFENILKNKTKKEKNEYLKNIEEPLLDFFINKTKILDVSILKEKRKRCEFTYKNVVDLLSINNIHISLFTYKSYENAQRRIPEKLYNQINDLYDQRLKEIEDKYQNNINTSSSNPLIDTMDTQKHKKETIDIIDEKNSIDYVQKDVYKKYDDFIENFNNSQLDNLEKDFFKDCFKYMKTLDNFYRKSNEKYYSSKEILVILNNVSFADLLSTSLEIFHSIKFNENYEFKTPKNMMNFFITCLIDKCESLHNQQKNTSFNSKNNSKSKSKNYTSENSNITNKSYNWFDEMNDLNNSSVLKQTSSKDIKDISNIPNEIRNYNWWED